MNSDLRSRELAHRLREARLAADLSGNYVSKALGLSQGQLSRMESGHRSYGFLFAIQVLGLCQVPPAERDEILDLIRTSGTDDGHDRRHGCWVRPHRDGPPESVSTVLFAHSTAETVTCWDPTSIPTMAQTQEFIEAVTRRECVDKYERTRWIEARQKHHEVLFSEDAPNVTAYVHETSLRTLPVEQDIRQSQYIQLAMLSGQQRLHLRIVPTGVDRALMGGGFSWIRFAEFMPAVSVPGDTVTLILEGQHLTPFRHRLATLDATALSEQDSTLMIMDFVERPPAGVETTTLPKGIGR